MVKRYEWKCPQEWLLEKAREWDAKALYSALAALTVKTDADTVQDIFQEDMENDGYFAPIGAE